MLSTAHGSITGVSEICSTCAAYSSERMIEQLKLSHTVKLLLQGEKIPATPDFHMEEETVMLLKYKCPPLTPKFHLKEHFLKTRSIRRL